MSKSKKVKYDMTPYNDYVNYLKNYDTSNVDGTLSNLSGWAKASSAQNLADMGDYTFDVNGSDEARRRAEDAIYASTTDKLNPQFERQTQDYATLLQNQGLPVGSEAYERAMGDLFEKQNESVRQAAYASVLGGQEAFSQSLKDEMNAGNFNNAAQQSYINQLLSALNGSVSGYNKEQNLLGVRTGQANMQYAQDKANANGGWQNALAGALQGAAAGYTVTKSPYGAVGGALLGSYNGYNTNPYGSKVY